MTSSGGLRRRARAPESTRRVTRPRLDLGDLQAIEQLVGQVGPVEMSSADFEGAVSSIDEFVSTGEKALDSLKIAAHDEKWQHLEFSFARGDASLYGTTTDPRIAGLMQQLEALVQRRSGAWAEKLEFGAGVWSMAFLVMAGTWLALAGVTGKGEVAPGWLVGYACGFAVALVLWLWARTVRGQVLLVRRDEAPGWFTRNRDPLIVGIVTGVMGSLGGYLLGRMGG